MYSINGEGHCNSHEPQLHLNLSICTKNRRQAACQHFDRTYNRPVYRTIVKARGAEMVGPIYQLFGRAEKVETKKRYIETCWEKMKLLFPVFAMHLQQGSSSFWHCSFDVFGFFPNCSQKDGFRSKDLCKLFAILSFCLGQKLSGKQTPGNTHQLQSTAKRRFACCYVGFFVEIGNRRLIRLPSDVENTTTKSIASGSVAWKRRRVLRPQRLFWQWSLVQSCMSVQNLNQLCFLFNFLKKLYWLIDFCFIAVAVFLIGPCQQESGLKNHRLIWNQLFATQEHFSRHQSSTKNVWPVKVAKSAFALFQWQEGRIFICQNWTERRTTKAWGVPDTSRSGQNVSDPPWRSRSCQTYFCWCGTEWLIWFPFFPIPPHGRNSCWSV